MVERDLRIEREVDEQEEEEEQEGRGRERGRAEDMAKGGRRWLMLLGREEEEAEAKSVRQIIEAKTTASMYGMLRTARSCTRPKDLLLLPSMRPRLFPSSPSAHVVSLRSGPSTDTEQRYSPSRSCGCMHYSLFCLLFELVVVGREKRSNELETKGRQGKSKAALSKFLHLSSPPPSQLRPSSFYSTSHGSQIQIPLPTTWSAALPARPSISA